MEKNCVKIKMLKLCDRKFFKILNICNLHSVDVYSEAESCVLVRMASNSAIYLRLPNAGITGIGLLFCFIKLILKQINKKVRWWWRTRL